MCEQPHRNESRFHRYLMHRLAAVVDDESGIEATLGELARAGVALDEVDAVQVLAHPVQPQPAGKARAPSPRPAGPTGSCRSRCSSSIAAVSCRSWAQDRPRFALPTAAHTSSTMQTLACTQIGCGGAIETPLAVDAPADDGDELQLRRPAQGGGEDTGDLPRP